MNEEGCAGCQALRVLESYEYYRGYGWWTTGMARWPSGPRRVTQAKASWNSPRFLISVSWQGFESPLRHSFCACSLLIEWCTGCRTFATIECPKIRPIDACLAHFFRGFCSITTELAVTSFRVRCEIVNTIHGPRPVPFPTFDQARPVQYSATVHEWVHWSAQHHLRTTRFNFDCTSWYS